MKCVKSVLQIAFMTCVIVVCVILSFFGFVAGQNSANRYLAKQIKRSRAPSYTTRQMRVTAYCPCVKCCGKWADGYTASGHKIKPGDKFVAAPKDIAFGTMIYIPGYGKAPTLDRGGSIKGDRLDVFFDDFNGISGHDRALNWGVQNLEVRIEQ